MRNNESSEPFWLKQTLIYFALLMMIGAGLNAFTSRFVPNAAGITIALLFAAVSAGVGGYRAVRSMDRYKGDQRTRSLIMRCVLGVGLMAWFGWMAGMEPLEIYTAFAGSPGVQQEVSSGWRRQSFRYNRCAGPDIAGVPLIMSVCADPSRKAELQEGRPVSLVGRVSSVGIAVDSVE